MVFALRVGCHQQSLGLLFANNSFRLGWSLSASLRQFVSFFQIAILETLACSSTKEGGAI
jgi:hypothetical protein